MYHDLSMVAIPYEEAPQATPLFQDYIQHFDRVRRFYGNSPFEFASYRDLVRQIEDRYTDRGALVEILTRQNQALGCGEETLASIRRLADPDAFAAVTGQQVGLFSGPAFTFYKALTAVRVARSLTEQGLRCVPVFWLATEDHDLDEVAKTAVWDEAGAIVTLADSGARPAPQSSVGHVKLSPEVSHTIDELEKILPAGEQRDILIHDVRQCYAPGVTWGKAFGRLMARLFSRFGVVLVDPLDERLHHLSRRAYERALQGSGNLRELLQKRSRDLIDSGYHAQVHVGDDSTLLFAALDGNRIALRQRDGRFFLEQARAVSAAEMEDWIATRPQDFSPSALLRPVIQDTLLPTIAYVAGPAELAYFGQAQTLYPEFGRPMPVLFPRAGFTLADHRLARIMEKYQVTLQDVWKGEEHLRRRIAVAGASSGAAESRPGSSHGPPGQEPGSGRPVELAARERENGVESMGAGEQNPAPGREDWAKRLTMAEEAIRRLFGTLSQDVTPIDSTLVDAVRNSEEKMLYQLDRLKGKISRAAVQRSELLSRHEQDLLNFLMPGG
ncbi:MAG: bacillithiol biosynthesis cysteine-adding enzyme BshC, partial [Terriglobia bacterium]